jgi:uncharacterized membrane protein YphA (DoxX/SURF4 family)
VLLLASVNPTSFFVLRIAVGTVLIGAAIGKTVHPRAFIRAVRAYRLLPTALCGPCAVAVIVAEWFAGVLLVIGFAIDAAAAIAIALFATFVYALAANLASGSAVPCHCFGEGSEPTGRLALFRATLLLALSALVVAQDGTGLEALANKKVAAVLLGVAIALVIRSLTLLGEVWDYLRAPGVLPAATRSRRVSFKNHPVWASVFPTSAYAKNGNRGAHVSELHDLFRVQRGGR